MFVVISLLHTSQDPTEQIHPKEGGNQSSSNSFASLRALWTSWAEQNGKGGMGCEEVKWDCTEVQRFQRFKKLLEKCQASFPTNTRLKQSFNTTGTLRSLFMSFSHKPLPNASDHLTWFYSSQVGNYEWDSETSWKLCDEGFLHRVRKLWSR